VVVAAEEAMEAAVMAVKAVVAVKTVVAVLL
jgi:hypothetical protein